MSELSIISFNCRGAIPSYPYIDHLLAKCDILCIQEHHLIPETSEFLSSINTSFRAKVKLCSKNDTSDGEGYRPRQGGIAIMWRKSINYTIRDINSDLYGDRIMGICIKNQGIEPVYIFNVYLPSTNVTISEYTSVIDQLRIIYDSYNNKGIVLIAGDYNAQLGPGYGPRSGTKQTIRGKVLHEFLNDNYMLSLNTAVTCSGPTPTFYPNDNIRCPTVIDHVLIAVSHQHLVSQCSVADYVALNTSDHVPITFSIKCDIPRYSVKNRDMYNWSKGDIISYSNHLNDNLQAHVSLPMTSTNDVDKLLGRITDTIKHSMDETIPKLKFSQFRRPYWDDDLRTAHRTQLEARHIGILNGRPRGSTYHSYCEYKLHKRAYRKLLIRTHECYCAKQFEDIDNNFEMDPSSIWKHLRKCQTKDDSQNNIIHDDVLYSSPDELQNVWKRHFSKLLNEQPSEKTSFNEHFNESITASIRVMEKTFSKDIDNTEIMSSAFTVDEIKSVCANLPRGKAPGYDGIGYEAVKFGNTALYSQLATLFNSMTMLVHIPENLKINVIIPLHKGKGKPKDNVKSYRGVSLSPVLYKLYEKLIYNRLQPWLEQKNFPPPLQHAGRKGHSSITLSYSIQEVIKYYTEQHGCVYGCMLDLEQAFDKVSWQCLLFKLSELQIKDKLWWIFRNSLLGSKCCILLNGQLSDSFTITRSIKQGGILSMFYFIVAYHDIHEYVSQSGDALQFYGRNVGSLTLADDTFLLSNTVRGLQNMIDLASNFAQKWRFNFSSAKTKCVTFGESKIQNSKNISIRKWYLNGAQIDEVQYSVHVGVHICSYNSTIERTKSMSRKGYAIYGKLIGCGLNKNGLSPLTSSHVWHRMALPSMLYSCELWGELPQNQINTFEKVQKTVAKSLQGLNWRTHDEITRGLIGWYTISGYINKAKLNFIYRLINSSGIVKWIFLHRIYCCIFDTHNCGITYDLFNVMRQYDLHTFLYAYLYGGDFPLKQVWKSLVKDKIEMSETRIWQNGLRLKNSSRFLSIQSNLKPNFMYYVLCQNRNKKEDIMTMIRLLTIIQNDDEMLCILCNQTLTDSVEHYLLRCTALIPQRTVMIDEYMDNMNVFAETQLLNMDLENQLCIMLGQSWPGYNDQERKSGVLIVAKHFKIFRGIMGI